LKAVSSERGKPIALRQIHELQLLLYHGGGPEDLVAEAISGRSRLHNLFYWEDGSAVLQAELLLRCLGFNKARHKHELLLRDQEEARRIRYAAYLDSTYAARVLQEEYEAREKASKDADLEQKAVELEDKLRALEEKDAADRDALRDQLARCGLKTLYRCMILPTEDTVRTPEELVMQRDRAFLLRNMLAGVSSLEKLVLLKYFYEECTLEEIGSIIGRGTERVRQIKQNAIRKLQHRVQYAHKVVRDDWLNE